MFNLSLAQADTEAQPATKPSVFNLSLPPADTAPQPAAKPSVFNLSLPPSAPPPATTVDPTSQPAGQTPLQEKTQRELQNILSELLRVSAHDLAPEVAIGEYGLDSIVITEFIGHINRLYELNVMPLALLDYPTLQTFAGYLCEAYPDALAYYYD